MEKDKQVIIDFGNVRIKEYDNYNYVIEVLKDTVNPKTKEKLNRWHRAYYNPTLYQSLRTINRNELLMDKEQIKDTKDILKQMQPSYNMIEKEIESFKKEG